METKAKDVTHPSMEPMLPATKGSAIPRMALLVASDLDNEVLGGVSLYDDSVDVIDGDDGDGEDSSAKTSDAGRNTLQHQS